MLLPPCLHSNDLSPSSRLPPPPPPAFSLPLLIRITFLSASVWEMAGVGISSSTLSSSSSPHMPSSSSFSLSSPRSDLDYPDHLEPQLPIAKEPEYTDVPYIRMVRARVHPNAPRIVHTHPEVPKEMKNQDYELGIFDRGGINDALWTLRDPMSRILRDYVDKHCGAFERREWAKSFGDYKQWAKDFEDQNKELLRIASIRQDIYADITICSEVLKEEFPDFPIDEWIVPPPWTYYLGSATPHEKFYHRYAFARMLQLDTQQARAVLQELFDLIRTFILRYSDVPVGYVTVPCNTCGYHLAGKNITTEATTCCRCGGYFCIYGTDCGHTLHSPPTCMKCWTNPGHSGSWPTHLSDGAKPWWTEKPRPSRITASGPPPPPSSPQPPHVPTPGPQPTQHSLVDEFLRIMADARVSQVGMIADMLDENAKLLKDSAPRVNPLRLLFGP